MEANIESLDGLEKNLKEQGYNIEKLPIVMQWNKRDLPNISPVDELRRKLNRWDCPEFEAMALKGDGVFETLKTMSKHVLMNIKGGLN